MSRARMDGSTGGWRFRPLALAVGCTLLLFLALPMLEGNRPADLHTREIETSPPVALPRPPPPPPPPEVEVEIPREAEMPRPVWQDSPRPPPPPPLPVDLSAAPATGAALRQVEFPILSPGEGDGLAQAIFEITDLDHPPRPLSRMPPLYPPSARLRRIEGVVRVEFVVDVRGEVRDVQILESHPEGSFGEAVRRAVSGWRFEPGEKGGRAVPVRVSQRIDFDLE